jgi:hypothetical protein
VVNGRAGWIVQKCAPFAIFGRAIFWRFEAVWYELQDVSRQDAKTAKLAGRGAPKLEIFGMISADDMDCAKMCTIRDFWPCDFLEVRSRLAWSGCDTVLPSTSGAWWRRSGGAGRWEVVAGLESIFPGTV